MVAKEALNKAQVLDPDYSLAWVGQAVIATADGKPTEASALFEHAVSLVAHVVSQSMVMVKRILNVVIDFSPTRTLRLQNGHSTNSTRPLPHSQPRLTQCSLHSS